MMKQQMYKNLLNRKTDIEYSLNMIFGKTLFNIDKAKTLTKTNQL